MDENVDCLDKPGSTFPQHCNICVRGMANDPAQQIAQTVGAILIEIGRTVDLSTLDGVTIAADYEDALSELDRGVEGIRAEERTNDGNIIGVAKASLVKRGNQIKTHLVFDAGPLCCFALEECDKEDMNLAIGIIAHECAHVEEHGVRDTQFPNIILQKQYDSFYDAHLQSLSEAIWCEYAACRISSIFCDDHDKFYREALESSLNNIDERVRGYILDYRYHGDVARAFSEVGSIIAQPLRMAAYFFGHIDGLKSDAYVDVKDAIDIEDEDIFNAIVLIVGKLRSLWSSRKEWSSHEEMQSIGMIVFEFFHCFGIHISILENGEVYIDIPHTPETSPHLGASTLTP